MTVSGSPVGRFNPTIKPDKELLTWIDRGQREVNLRHDFTIIFSTFLIQP